MMQSILTAIRKEHNFFVQEAADVLKAMIARFPSGSKTEDALLDALMAIEGDLEASVQATDPAPDNGWIDVQNRALEGK